MVGIGKNIARAQQGKAPTFSGFMASDAVRAKINEMIGGKDGQRFMTSIIAAVSINPILSECEHWTILSAAMQGEALKLSPAPQLGHYSFVPRNDKKRGCKVASFQIGYKGYIQLAVRSGYYKSLNVVSIKEGELIKYNPLTEEIEVNLIEDEDAREAAPTVGYYAMFEYLNGFRKAIYWSRGKMERHADKYSDAFNMEAYRKLQAGKIPEADRWKYSSFWYKDFDAMAYKTMLRQLISKWGIMSIELQQAFERDGTVMDEKGGFEYVDGETGEIIDVQPDPAPEPAKAPAVEVLPPEPEAAQDEGGPDFFKP